jgi:hypothetical protein
MSRKISKKKVKLEIKPEPLNAIKMVVHTRKLDSGYFQYSFVGILVSDQPLDNIAVDDHGDTILESVDTTGDVTLLHSTMCVLKSRPSKRQGLTFDQSALSMRDL